MSKRKILAGGYLDSSDEETGLDPGLRRLKSAPYAPPRLTAASRLVSSSFQLPGLAGSSPCLSVAPKRHVSVSSSSSRPTLIPESVQSVGSTPEIPTAPDSVAVSRGSMIEPSSTAISTVQTNTTNTRLEPPKLNHARSTLMLERQINELTGTLEEYRKLSETRQKATDETLARIYDTVSRLESIKDTAPTSQVLIPTLATASHSPSAKPYLSNPAPSPEPLEIISRVVSEARSRVGKKKGGADDNSCKEHARQTFYRMLGITAAREVRPYFEDEYGEPDTLPSQFIDPDTSYCQPYPHWKAPLTKQVAWVPTYILRFRTTIPNNRSELSDVLRNLSDEAIVILLNDGPFKSASAAWRDAKKSDVEIEVMRSNARRYQRSDRKATMRSGYIKTIPSLQGSAWEYLSHPGYVSQDESDNEGTLVTKRPEYRPQWEANLYDAIFVAEHEKAKAKPGLCPRLPHRRVDVVKRPIPHLERGVGSNKVTIRIPACGISKAWRQDHPEEFRKHAHLINMKELAKPDITLFLAQYPAPSFGGDEDRQCISKFEDGTVKLEGGWVGGESAGGLALDYDGDEESGAVLEAGYSTTGMVVPELSEGISDDMTHFPIDPQLTVEGIRDNAKQSGGEDWPDALRMPSELHCAARDAPPAFSDGYLHSTSQSSEMPPPPLLSLDLSLVASQAAADNVSPADNKLTKPRANKAGSTPIKVDKSEEGDLPSSTAAPRRRGRPPGSKNKKKVTS